MEAGTSRWNLSEDAMLSLWDWPVALSHGNRPLSHCLHKALNGKGLRGTESEESPHHTHKYTMQDSLMKATSQQQCRGSLLKSSVLFQVCSEEEKTP